MLSILSSPAKRQSTHFRKRAKSRGENNLTWLEQNLGEPRDGVFVLLIGGKDPSAFRVRVAQSQLRNDLTPSHWSHAALLLPGEEKDLAAAPLYEIRLDPPSGFGFPPPANGLQTGKVGDYRESADYPNIAIARLPVEVKAVKEQLERFKKQRAVLDAPDLIVSWLGFVWGAGRAGNPLFDGKGIPSAAMVEAVISAAGYDLTPGLDARISTPEAIWQAGKWWHQYYEKLQQEPMTGAWAVQHELC